MTLNAFIKINESLKSITLTLTLRISKRKSKLNPEKSMKGNNKDQIGCKGNLKSAFWEDKYNRKKFELGSSSKIKRAQNTNTRN